MAEVEAWEVAAAGVVVVAAAVAADVFVDDAVERVQVVALEVWTKLELRCCYGQEVALATNWPVVRRTNPALGPRDGAYLDAN